MWFQKNNAPTNIVRNHWPVDQCHICLCFQGCSATKSESFVIRQITAQERTRIPQWWASSHTWSLLKRCKWQASCTAEKDTHMVSLALWLKICSLPFDIFHSFLIHSYLRQKQSTPTKIRFLACLPYVSATSQCCLIQKKSLRLMAFHWESGILLIVCNVLAGFSINIHTQQALRQLRAVLKRIKIQQWLGPQAQVRVECIAATRNFKSWSHAGTNHVFFKD